MVFVLELRGRGKIMRTHLVSYKRGEKGKGIFVRWGKNFLLQNWSKKKLSFSLPPSLHL